MDPADTAAELASESYSYMLVVLHKIEIHICDHICKNGKRI